MSNSGYLIGKPFFAIVDCDGTMAVKSDCVFIVKGYFVPKGYRAYIIGKEMPEEYARNLATHCPNSSVLYNVPNIDVFCSHDIINVNSYGVVRFIYQDSSPENILFITNECNSNCIMCPDSTTSRKRHLEYQFGFINQLIEYIPSDTPHLTITGGEPTLLKWDFIKILNKCKEKFTNTEFLLLSNGRAFSNKEYRDAFLASIPNNFRIAVPLYGANQEDHDFITRTPNSFQQTISSLKVLQYRTFVEIRIVVIRDTYQQLPQIARYLISSLPNIKTVSIMGMEILGNAAKRRNELWVDFQDSVPYIQESVEILLSGGIDVKIYNYPLCNLPRSLWGIAVKSISYNKIKFPAECGECAVKDLCGGFFASTLHFANIKVFPIH